MWNRLLFFISYLIREYFPEPYVESICMFPARPHFCSVGQKDDISSIAAMTAVLSVCPEITSCQLAVVCVMPCKEVRKQSNLRMCLVTVH